VPRRIGRWAYDGNEPRPGWHLDGSPVVLDYDDKSHACCMGAAGCRGGAYLLSGFPGRHDWEPVDQYLRGAMEWAEKAWDGSVLRVAAILAFAGLIVRRFTGAQTPRSAPDGVPRLRNES
jgi:hypothetical protein